MERRVVEPPAGIPWPGCMLSGPPNSARTLPAWIIAILVATIFLGLTLYLLYSKEIRNIQPVTLALVRDSVLFYFPMFGILIASVPLVVIYRTALANVTAPIILALYSFCASRLIIHIRESFVRSSHGEPSREMEPIDFAIRPSMASHAGTHA
ncbi:hypothetical protein BKA82DRAFT_265504 [Pisolithus tinctorius]|uniref:Uncharacterized protein n=1 Tax=Pisolithus tinctorius Marx 270 TaxID=870435 RepID=A0A0C3PL54_PISTI|nr:hypothetical protein BKA82DRAFT_265504 [Pisolithus tinctorius]KIO09436.1 hypothetical protein M404DRAFT_265504 [Pisolithus tinctorius Marx 270]